MQYIIPFFGPSKPYCGLWCCAYWYLMYVYNIPYTRRPLSATAGSWQKGASFYLLYLLPSGMRSIVCSIIHKKFQGIAKSYCIIQVRAKKTKRFLALPERLYLGAL